MSKQTDRINADAVQAANDYRAAKAALGLPDFATPLEVSARIKKLLDDSLEYALLLGVLLGDDRIVSEKDFRLAISAVRLLRHKLDGAYDLMQEALGNCETCRNSVGVARCARCETFRQFVESNRLQVCGHPLVAIVTSRDGTNYCRDCAAENPK